MTRHTSAPHTYLQLGSTHEPLSQLVDQWRRGMLDPSPPYQRADVWTLEQRIRWVESAISGTPRVVIDGKQRLTATRLWLDSELAVPATWFADDEVDQTLDLDADPQLADRYGDTGHYVIFAGLTPTGRRVFDARAGIDVAEGHFATVREEAALYLRINGSGTPQTAEDMARAAIMSTGQQVRP